MKTATLIENESIDVLRDGVRWRTTKDYQFLIDSLNGTLSRVDQKNVIKSSSIRRVVTLKISHKERPLEVFVKHHRLTLKEILKDLLFISKARNEWKMAHQIADAGVPTVTPLAFGECRRNGFLRESYFISERISNCETLHDFVIRESKKSHSPAYLTWKREFIKKLARMVAHVHRQGIDHRDFHAGNILIERKNGEIYFRLLDLDRARVYHKLPLKKRIRELALFNMFFTLFISRSDRLRFFKEYYRYDPLPWNGYEDPARLIEAKSRKMCNHLYHRRDKACLRENKTFRRFSSPPFSGVFRKELVRGRMVDILSNPEKFISEIKTESVKKSSEKTLRKFPVEIQGRNIEVILKSYEAKNWGGKIKDLFRTCRAMKCWYAANALHQRKIPTAMPLAYVVKKKWGGILKSYYFYEFVDNASVLALYLEDQFCSPLTPEKRRAKRRLLNQFARFVGNLHDLSIYHGDLKASNILVQEKKPGEYAFYLIDLDYVKVCCSVNRYQRYRNLMQLNKSFLDRKIISQTDRLDFLRAYLRFSSRNPKVVRRAWYVVTQLTARRLRKTSKSFSS